MYIRDARVKAPFDIIPPPLLHYALRKSKGEFIISYVEHSTNPLLPQHLHAHDFIQSKNLDKNFTHNSAVLLIVFSCPLILIVERTSVKK